MGERTGESVEGDAATGLATEQAEGDAQVAPAKAAIGRSRNSLLVAVVPVLVLGVLLLVLPLLIPSFLQSLVTKMMIFSIFAVSMNILWGYAGIPTFGHAVFFGAGGYAAGILVLKGGVTNFWLNLLLAVLFAAAVAALLGFPAFRVFGVGAGTANPVYFLLVTLAFGEIAARVAIALRSLTGGSTGMAGIPYPDLGIGVEMTPGRYYYLVLAFAVVCIYIMYRIVKSHYGYALKGIHDNEKRMQALGYNTWLYKYTSWVIAGTFGGVAGVFFAYFGGVMTPNNLAMLTSEIAFLAVIIGGATIFYGPIVGVIIFVGIEYLASLYLPDRWPLILGAVFVVSIMLLPQGVGVMIQKLWGRLVHGAS
ncbi:MAG TPA: branched-chain amino acid ABC transporter permease [Thermoleophilia bacterium]|nr:branched-chain amino acid ABC transporter permease [Thermoleophilia bacterium]